MTALLALVNGPLANFAEGAILAVTVYLTSRALKSTKQTAKQGSDSLLLMGEIVFHFLNY